MKKLLADLETAENAIHDYFGYEGDWHQYPIDDETDAYWREDGSEVQYQYEPIKNPVEGEFDDLEELEYSGEIIEMMTADKFTAIILDTNCDGNQYFAIFDNDKKMN